MTLSIKKTLVVIASLLWIVNSIAATGEDVCSELSGYFRGDEASKLPSPSRDLTPLEQLRIDESKIDFLQRTDYAMGVSIVDAENEGGEELFVWNIQGTGRFVYAELYEIPLLQNGQPKPLIRKASMQLGVLLEPRFVRFKDANYLVSTETGDSDGTRISRIAKTSSGGYELRTLCQMKIEVQPDASCRHPACKELQEVIKNRDENGAFVNVEWPHKYFSPAGLEVYYSSDWSVGDFDNTGVATSIWRIGRDHYVNQHIYWALVGQGDEMPNIDPRLRPRSESIFARSVLPGPDHDRLRRTLKQQSEALSNQLHRPISLPNVGNFFLFTANGSRTYWAWDFGSPPYGQEIHITYSKAGKSDYVGKIRVARSQALKPCTSNCAIALGR